MRSFIIQRFKDAIEACGLKDMGCSGYHFTWSNRRGDHFIEERLDRVLATDDWLDLFLSVTVSSIIWDSSDHLPILVKACREGVGVVGDYRWDARPFKFEAKWLHVKEFKEVVERVWSTAERSKYGSCTDKVNHCGRILDKWGSIHSKIFIKVSDG